MNLSTHDTHTETHMGMVRGEGDGERRRGRERERENVRIDDVVPQATQEEQVYSIS